MGRGKPLARRTPRQVGADDASGELMRKLGRMLRDARKTLRWTQEQGARGAGISRSEWSELERGKTVATLHLVNRAAFAVGGGLDAWIRQASAADQPRDAVHLRNQELVIRHSRPGGWMPLPEEFIDRDARTSRAADVLLTRLSGRDGIREYALWDITDWIDDAGAAVRDFTRRVAAVDRYAVARMRPGDQVPRTGGCWVVRATLRNRRLIGEHRYFFRARFPGSGRAWIACLTRPHALLPAKPALVWVSVRGDRLFPARLG